MENILLRFSLTPAPLTRFTYAWMGVVWVLVLVAAFIGLRGQAWPRRTKIAWALVLVGLPLLGLLAYLMASRPRAGRAPGPGGTRERSI